MPKIPANTFGQSVSSILKSRGMTQEQLAEATGKSQSYTNQIITGRKTASARWADLVADTLALSDHERSRLHVAAAKDNGFKIELPPLEDD